MACAESNDGAAWEEFVSRFYRSISLSIIRTAQKWGALPQQVVDDLVQETYLKLCASKCRLLRDFALRHPDAIEGYIKTIAINVAHDHFKSLHSLKRGEQETCQLSDDFDPQAHGAGAGGQAAIEREILMKQLETCLEANLKGPTKDRDRLIFWLYYQQGMTAKTIAALPAVGLDAKGVESVIFRLTRLVREEITGVRLKNSAPPQPGEKGFRPAESY
ncbi:MAG: sigma-70 family RNA polymerase sigma factor [Candidatus Sulfotelmatobacter sp.]